MSFLSSDLGSTMPVGALFICGVIYVVVVLFIVRRTK